MKTEIYYLIQHMKYCRYSDRTIKLYVYHIQLFLDAFKLDPKHISETQIKDYMLTTKYS